MASEDQGADSKRRRLGSGMAYGHMHPVSGACGAMDEEGPELGVSSGPDGRRPHPAREDSGGGGSRAGELSGGADAHMRKRGRGRGGEAVERTELRGSDNVASVVPLSAPARSPRGGIGAASGKDGTLSSPALEPSGVRLEGDAEVSASDSRALVDEAAVAVAAADSGHASDDEDEELFPVGDSSYAACVDGNQWLVDRTEFIKHLMRSKKALLFTRPRRFGKSMTLNMLAAFLDKRNAGEPFDKLFGHTWIGRPENERFRAKHASQYFVLELDFSGIPHASPDAFADGFQRKLVNGLHRFALRYKDFTHITDPALHPVDAIERLGAEVQATESKLVVLIDEYDQAANRMLDPSSDDTLFGIKKAADLVSSFFDTLKTMLKGAVTRVILTGVSPLFHIGIGSAFNVAHNISQDPKFEVMCGLREADVREGIVLALLARSKRTEGSQVDRAELFASAKRDALQPNAEVDTHLDTIRRWYNGYRFSDDAVLAGTGESLYNAQLVLRYLDILSSLGFVRESKRSDPNVSLSDGIVTFLATLPGAAPAITDFAITGRACSGLFRTLTINDLRDARNEDEARSGDLVRSLLYHYGAATLATDQSRASSRTIELTIPNEVVAEEFLPPLTGRVDVSVLERLRVELERVWDCGDPSAFICEVVASGLFSSIVRQRYRAGGALEYAFQEQLTLLARRASPPSRWARVHFEHSAPTLSAAGKVTTGRADVIFSDTDDGSQPRVVVELKAMRERAVQEGITGLAAQNAELADLEWGEAARKLSDEDLLSLSDVRRVHDGALEQVTKYKLSGDPARYVAVLITPSRVIVTEVGST